MNKIWSLGLDVGLAVALGGALLTVSALDRRGEAPKPPEPAPGEQLAFKVHYGEVPKESQAAAPKRFRLAVTPVQYDDMGTLLRQLGAGYSYTDLSREQLRRPDALAQYDVVFLTCNGGDENDQVMSDALRGFVDNGGTLYASDLRFDLLARAFPDAVDRDAIRAGMLPGVPESVQAEVADPGLRKALALPQIPLKFNLGGWKPAAFKANRATTYLAGDYHTGGGQVRRAPLMAKFSSGRGTVIFTSFHNAAGNGELAKKLLQYLVFEVVTSQVDREMNEKLVQGGFAPKQSSLITATQEVPEVTQTYTSKKAGKLRFALGFNAEPGTRLRLTVRSPDQKVARHEHTAGFTLEIPNAAAGDWQYTVTAVQVPYPNFPFRVAVGEEK